MIKLAQNRNIVSINVHNLRDWTKDKHKTVDDRPFGGGVGMIMKIEPIYYALKQLKTKHSKVILLSAKGKQFDQDLAWKLSKEKHLIFICPHYEGVDQRVVDHLTDYELSIGPYILTGGELPAMVICDAIIRLIPGVVGKKESLEMESFSNITVNGKCHKVLEYPQYTQPAIFKTEEGETWKVPEILLSGNHERIKLWKIANSKIIDE
jgi:tRNA (guanine37-N1)-methyltransferase